MFELTVKDKFCAAHKIDGHAGKCANLHGHTYTVELSFCTDSLDELGIAFDFSEAKTILSAIVSKFDHTFLNDSELFIGCRPTAEKIAMVVFDLATSLKPKNIIIDSVTVRESENSCVKYKP
jgi:6-pyruvoyltetrahydropterin/6-carboxytetrahydropterin synthase